MWFKNLKVFRLAPDFQSSAQDLETKLERKLFQPVSRLDMQNMGWVPPCGGGLVLALGGERVR